MSPADPEKPGKHRVTGVCMGKENDPVVLIPFWSMHPAFQFHVLSVLLSADGVGEILANSVIITTGTFLSGSLFMGRTTSPGGRMGEPPSCAGLSHSLREVLGLKLSRLRTGTPPRIIKDTIDFSLAELHLPDPQPTPFSFLNKRIHCKVRTE